MNNVRGWKSRRDLAAKRNALGDARYEIRRARAAVVGAVFTETAVELGEDKIADPAVLEAPEAVDPVPEAPLESTELKVAPKKGGRPKKQPETQDGFIIED